MKKKKKRSGLKSPRENHNAGNNLLSGHKKNLSEKRTGGTSSDPTD